MLLEYGPKMQVIVQGLPSKFGPIFYLYRVSPKAPFDLKLSSKKASTSFEYVVQVEIVIGLSPDL